jgi:hypothetical protein
MPCITSVEVVDVRFPTSLTSDGSDAMNKDGDHSAAYVVLHTDDLPASPTHRAHELQILAETLGRKRKPSNTERRAMYENPYQSHAKIYCFRSPHEKCLHSLQ